MISALPPSPLCIKREMVSAGVAESAVPGREVTQLDEDDGCGVPAHAEDLYVGLWILGMLPRLLGEGRNVGRF